MNDFDNITKTDVGEPLFPNFQNRIVDAVMKFHTKNGSRPRARTRRRRQTYNGPTPHGRPGSGRRPKK